MLKICRNTYNSRLSLHLHKEVLYISRWSAPPAADDWAQSWGVLWGHRNNNRRLDFFSAFPLFSTFPCSSGLHSRKRPLSTLVFVFWILNVQRETFVPSTPRSPETSMPEMKLGYSSMSPHCPRFQFGGGKREQAEFHLIPRQ